MAHRLVVLPKTERARLAGLARQSRCRTSTFSKSRPCQWDPFTTLSAAGYSYGDAGTWALVADCLESEISIYTIALDKPPGAWAYVLFLPPTDTWRGVYMKFEVTGPGLHGRSFHHPEHPTLDVESDDVT
jgi:hypothetical protein